jgi:hypothetical protein
LEKEWDRLEIVHKVGNKIAPPREISRCNLHPVAMRAAFEEAGGHVRGQISRLIITPLKDRSGQLT